MSHLTETRGESVFSHARTHVRNFVARDRETPAGDSEFANFFWPNQRAINPELNSRVGAAIGNEVFGINRRLRFCMRTAEHLSSRNGPPYAIGFLYFNNDLRFSRWKRDGNSKPNALNRCTHVLAFNPVITRKHPTCEPSTDGTDILTLATDAPTGNVKSSHWPFPI